MNNDIKKIRETIENYFKGTYTGNRNQLKKIFHPDANITGSIKGKMYDLSLDDFILRVTTSPTALENNESYKKDILFIDQVGDVAIVKTKVNVGPYIFTDYISLLKIDGEWIIRHKSFTT